MASSQASTPLEYISELPEERQVVIKKLRNEIKKNLPEGFEEVMSYGMIGYVVPHSLFPQGYHCDPRLPLPFIAIAAQKNHFAVYHMGIYADPILLEWFQKEYMKQATIKPDLGKSCLRFKKAEHIPYELLGELSSKMTVEDWIAIYKRSLQK
ncbi:DUF1801 domain-containing protein [Flavihumibacter sp. ZG627]|uniref:DUF1801 domain-containing protein n=1 Tax=Flavihumibacter sp. ZG627 TaxID=1463156 RepID=UPI00057DB535|nr:DUF1801 domain-containing protein [Flavihumibacter sp. ZG627]KIC91476.1 hypothetical protein HY58_04325 [Flavihumibacter sp. ZG627]